MLDLYAGSPTLSSESTNRVRVFALLREILSMPTTERIRDKLSHLPDKPGGYLMKDRFGTVIYVGKARDLRRRVGQYFAPRRGDSAFGWRTRCDGQGP